MDPVLHGELEGLQRLRTGALRARYRQLFGEEPVSSNRGYLLRRLAWRLQAQAEGDLSERARRRAAELASELDLRRAAPSNFRFEPRHSLAPQRDPRLPPTGTLLRRVFRGRTIEVKVLGDGFEYNSRDYGSLSAIAYQVTGTRWNGFVFFGLMKAAAHE